MLQDWVINEQQVSHRQSDDHSEQTEQFSPDRQGQHHHGRIQPGNLTHYFGNQNDILNNLHPHEDQAGQT